jgi:hypothetical protein
MRTDETRVQGTPVIDISTPVGVYEGVRAVTTQGYVEANTKLGVQFEGSTLLTIGGGASSDTIFLTGSNPVSLKGRKISYNGEGVTAEIYSTPTYTGGSPAAYQNANNKNPQVGESQIIVGATITDDGTLAFSPIHSLGNSGFFGGGSQVPGIESERILAPNTAYLLRLTNLDAGAQQVASHLSWYEGELDLPRP